MKELLREVNSSLEKFGYKKKGDSFWKVNNNFYNLIDFQKGAHGGGYFFVNVCVHPIGLPQLLTNQLLISEQPKEHECIFRQRIEQISKKEEISAFRKGLVSVDNREVIHAIINVIPTEVEQWLETWSTYEKIIDSKLDDVSHMMTVVPMLKEKALLMLKFYCSIRLGDNKKALQYFEQYLNTEVTGLKFPHIDSYLKSLLTP